MESSEQERKTKMVMIKTLRLALGFDVQEYRLFLGGQTGKRQLSRMTDQELELVHSALNSLLSEAVTERRRQRDLKAQSYIESRRKQKKGQAHD